MAKKDYSVELAQERNTVVTKCNIKEFNMAIP